MKERDRTLPRGRVRTHRRRPQLTEGWVSVAQLKADLDASIEFFWRDRRFGKKAAR